MWEHIVAWFNHEETLVTSANTFLVLATILLTGYACIKLSKKFKLPTVTGQIIGGIILGHYVLNIFQEEAYNSFIPITNFALGFIGLTIGSHLNFRKLHNAGRRIVLITLTDVIITPLLVFAGLYYIAGVDLTPSLLIAAIAITTAPGSTIHIVKERRAKGIFTKTLLAVVALNNVLTILIFYTVYYIIFQHGTSGEFSLIKSITNPLLILAESILIGGGVGWILIHFIEKRKTRVSFLALIIIAVVVTVGSSEAFHVSGILPSLILGVVITNFSNHKNLLFSAFKDIEVEIFSLFFVLAGTHLDFHAIKLAGFAGMVMIVTRLIGKTLGPWLGTKIAGSSDSVKKSMPIAMYSIAGVAIGLVLLIENNIFLKDYASEITAIVLTAVVVNELLGPIFTGKAIVMAGEEDKDRLRLMDFIQEEYILTDIESTEKWEAIDEMTDFLAKTHGDLGCNWEGIKESIIKREKDITTGIGNNLAIPHGVLQKGPKIVGAIGVSRKGIEFDSLDGEPVHIIFMIVTPQANFESQHLQVLSNIAKIFGHHPHIKNSIIRAKNSEEVYEILQTEEVEELNPFFKD